MEKHAHFISDNTPGDEPNTLRICQREDGDIEIKLTRRHLTERGVSIRAEGSRIKNNAKIIGLFSQLIDAINEEDIQFWVGKNVYQVVEHKTPWWHAWPEIESTTVTTAKIVNSKTCLYGQRDGVEFEITGEYFASHEEAKDKLAEIVEKYNLPTEIKKAFLENGEINEGNVHFWIGKTVYQIVTENVPVDEHRMQWEEQTYIKPVIVTAAKVVNGKTCLYGQCNGAEAEITGEYFTSQEEAEDRLEKGTQYYAK